MPPLRWSEGALRDIQRHHDFLAVKSRSTGKRVVRAIRAGLRVVGEHPEIGRPVDDYPDEYREWVIPFGNSAYVALYRLIHDGIFVVAIRHGREDRYGVGLDFTG